MQRKYSNAVIRTRDNSSKSSYKLIGAANKSTEPYKVLQEFFTSDAKELFYMMGVYSKNSEINYIMCQHRGLTFLVLVKNEESNQWEPANI